MDPRSLFITAMLVCFGAAVVNALWFGTELKRFTASTPVLASTHDLERFKAVVAHQMYAALGQIVLLAAPTILYFVGLFRGALAPPDLLFVVGPSAVILLIAASYRGWEVKARAIETADDELAAERDAVVATWIKKPFPDW
ncbi:MAG: hypothetical protein V2I67_08165 [Thermoanaerobaculales bacterium]|jgi:hypothetical protein|nr:hypothetical protein [Thermoanaerobaculales bacterium]